RTRLHTATDEDSLRRVVILGDPVDVAAGLTDGRRVCERVLQAWATDGINGAIRYLAYLGGRWTAVLDAVVAPGAAPEITVVPDCQASQAVFYSTVRGIALGSQPALVAETVGAGPDARSQQMWDTLRQARRTGVIFLPGTMTTHE